MRRGAEIRQVRRNGHRRHHPLLLLFATENDRKITRFAVSVSGRVGNAVVRNRARRRIREAIRRQLPHLRPGWDCLFVARNSLPPASFSQIEDAVHDLLTRAGVLA